MGKSKGYWQPSINDDWRSDYYGENYNSNNGTTRGRFSSYSWEPTKWSFWGSSVVVQDDDSKLFVKDPVVYETPSSEDIKKKTTAWKKSSIDTIKELARVCYFKMIDEKEYISEMFADVDQLSDSQKQDYETKKSFYDTIFDKYIPGNTPLEQAIAIYNTIQQEDAYANRGEKNEDEDGVNFETTLDFDRRVYADPDINEQLEFNELSKQRKMDILNIISIVGDLGQQFKVEKEVSEKIVSNSNTYAKKIMRDYSQFNQIELYQKMLPNFRTKLLTKNLTVNVPVDKKEQTQKIIILLDFSGSMWEPEKQIWVNGILIDRLKYVMRGEAEVFFSYFVNNPEHLNFRHIKDKKDVADFWNWFSNEPNGGMTEIGLMVEKVSTCVAKGNLHNLQVDLSQEKPEILIINDGQDSIRQSSFPYKTNAVTLMQENEKLKNLCIASGGKLVSIDYNNAVKSYVEDGVELVSDGKKIKKFVNN